MKLLLIAVPILGAALLAAPTASAQPGCTASTLSSTLGGVASATGAWLDAHPEANDVITAAGPSGNEDSIRTYFVSHQDQWAELQGIAAPLRSLRAQCDVDVAPAQVARLYDAMAS